jgi:hypothetical protein
MARAIDPGVFLDGEGFAGVSNPHDWQFCTVNFTMPSAPGQYEFRYFVPPNKTRVASSNVIVVTP